jgi:hypothetical protein
VKRASGVGGEGVKVPRQLPLTRSKTQKNRSRAGKPELHKGSHPRLAHKSPLAPVKRGRGVGGEGATLPTEHQRHPTHRNAQNCATDAAGRSAEHPHPRTPVRGSPDGPLNTALRGFAASRESNCPRPKRKSTELGLESPSYGIAATRQNSSTSTSTSTSTKNAKNTPVTKAAPRTRTQSALADGTRTRTRKTPLTTTLRGFAASRLRVSQTASTQTQKHRARAGKPELHKGTHTRGLPSAARLTDH